MQEVGADRAVTVLETRQHDAVFHLRHLGAGFDHEPVGGRRRPGRIPGAAGTFAHRARLEDIGGAARAADHGLGLEDVVVACAHIEADGTGDPVLLAVIHQQVGDADAVEDLVRGFLGGLGHDGLVGLAVNHDLPSPFTQIAPGFRVLHDGQAPLFELVHRGVDVTGHVEQQVFAHQPHQVDTSVADMVLRLILAPPGAHVAVDGVQALGDRAGAIDIGLLGNDDLLVLPPEPRLPGGAACRRGPHRRPEYRCRLRRSFCRPSVIHAFLQLETGGLERMQTAVIHADPLRLVVQELAVAHFLAGRGNVGELGDRRPPRLGRDRRQEILFRAVPDI